MSVARARAMRDPRNAIVATAANAAFCRGRSRSLIFNFDAVTFQTTEKSVKYLSTKEAKAGGMDTRSTQKGGLNLFLKLIPVINAKGQCGRTVIVIAKPDMRPNQMIVVKVKG